jgi:hypothetical protein
MQVEPFVLRQKEIAKSSTAILRAVVVVLCAAASHQSDVTCGKNIL